MKLLELMSHIRTGLNDHQMKNLTLFAWSQQAARQVYLELGGSGNTDIRNALQETLQDVVSQTRSVVVIPNDMDESVIPKATFEGKVCQRISKTAALTIDQHPRYKPAIVVEARRVTFYFDLPYRQPNAVNKSSFDVAVSYVRSPRPMYYLPGIQAKFTDVGYGIKGKEGLTEIEIIWPDARPTVTANELSGSFISLQTSEDERTDYRIEEHAAGTLTKLYVNKTGDVRPYFDPHYSEETKIKGFRATVHRGPELPEKYDQLIIDRAIALITGQPAAKAESKTKQ